MRRSSSAVKCPFKDLGGPLRVQGHTDTPYPEARLDGCCVGRNRSSNDFLGELRVIALQAGQCVAGSITKIFQPYIVRLILLCFDTPHTDESTARVAKRVGVVRPAFFLL
jgi:hypothetical protein